MILKKTIVYVMLCCVINHAAGQAVGDFQSFQTGSWTTLANWSRWDGTTWVNPAPNFPNSADGVITILNGHTMTTTASITVDQVVISNGGTWFHQSGGTASIANGTGDDVVVESGGTYRQQISSALSFSLPAIFRVKGGGMLEVTNSALISYATDATGKFIFDSASIFNYNASAGTLQIFGNTFFPLASTSVIPVFKASNWSSIGSTAGNCVFNGVFEQATTAKIFSTSGSGGTITFRNGIRGIGEIRQNASGAGQYLITGSPAELGGTGLLTLHTNGIAISTGAVVTIMNNKTVNGNAATNTLTVNGTLQCDNFILSGNASFVLSPGGTLKTGSANGIATAGSSGSIQNTGTTRAFDQSANYEYNGNFAQITGSGLPSSVRTLTLNNSVYETITLTASSNINDSLSLQKGFLLTTSGTLISLRDTTTIGSPNSNFNTSGSISNIGWERSFVKGPVAAQVGSSTNRWFPVGKISGTDTLFAPAAVQTSFVVPLTDTVEYFPTTYSDRTVDAGQLDHVSSIEYWKINSSVATVDANAKVTLTWRPFSKVGDGNPGNDAAALNDLVVAHYFDDDGISSNPFLWHIEGGPAVMTKGGGSTVNYGTVVTTVVNSPITALYTSPYFTLGTTSTLNILPLKLIEFSGYASTKSISLKWITKEERNVGNFELQKSTDGINFVTLTTISAFNSTGVNSYTETDINPVNGINYYRLKINDNAQKITYSPVVKIKFAGLAEINLYPNPVKDKLNINHDKAGNFTVIKIVSVSGVEMASQRIGVGQSQSTVNTNNLQQGWYILKFINGNEIINKAFYKQ